MAAGPKNWGSHPTLPLISSGASGELASLGLTVCLWKGHLLNKHLPVTSRAPETPHSYLEQKGRYSRPGAEVRVSPSACPFSLVEGPGPLRGRVNRGLPGREGSRLPPFTRAPRRL